MLRIQSHLLLISVEIFSGALCLPRALAALPCTEAALAGRATKQIWSIFGMSG